MKGKVVVKDKNDNICIMDKNDPRYISCEFVGVNKGMKWKCKKESNRKNMKWVNKDGVNTFIKKELVDEYISNGWNLGFKKSK